MLSPEDRKIAELEEKLGHRQLLIILIIILAVILGVRGSIENQRDKTGYYGNGFVDGYFYGYNDAVEALEHRIEETYVGTEHEDVFYDVFVMSDENPFEYDSSTLNEKYGIHPYYGTSHYGS